MSMLTTTTSVGIARNTAAAVFFLDSCPAVGMYTELNDQWLEFSYDPNMELSLVPHHLVWFDGGAAPEEARNIYHNSSSDELWLLTLTRRIASGDVDVDVTSPVFVTSLSLDEGWDWGEVLNKLLTRQVTREQIERAIADSLQTSPRYDSQC